MSRRDPGAPRFRGDGTNNPPCSIDPTTQTPGRGERAKVINGRDPHANQVGVIERVTFDAGDLLVRLRFGDGTTSEYWEDEILRRTAKSNGELGSGRE